MGLVALMISSWAKLVMAEPSSAIRSLSGVVAVRILVEDLNTAMKKTGLQKEHLYTLAQEALRKNGIHVLNPQDSGRVPLVYIRLSSVISGEGDNVPVGLYLNMQIRQMAVLENTQQAKKNAISVAEEKPLLVSTWENGTMAMIARKEIGFYVRTLLTNLVGDLARDHREANGLSPQG
jgi:hypothetical protein